MLCFVFLLHLYPRVCGMRLRVRWESPRLYSCSLPLSIVFVPADANCIASPAHFLLCGSARLCFPEPLDNAAVVTTFAVIAITGVIHTIVIPFSHAL